MAVLEGRDDATVHDGRHSFVSLSLAGQIDPDGFFVVADPNADPTTILTHANMQSSKVDFQNGPDSVQLRYGDQIIDAVGYGSFSGAVFAGEGSPAPDTPEGQSLARGSSSTDTDDNSVDFTPQSSLTPGAANP